MMRKMQSVLYFHGLESQPGGLKVKYLNQNFDFVDAPPMDYKKKDLFEDWLEYVKTEEPDLIIGSSMGGYFAYALASHTGIPVLLFNPALHNRSFEVEGVHSGEFKPEGKVILGKKDNVIDPSITKAMLKNSNLEIEEIEEMEHRVPLDIFINEVENLFVYNE
jgi:hypothetical protein|tara:strand:- start:295 stop:783 length:489 start_codon:yes stop_codon:yes gene_type:complete